MAKKKNPFGNLKEGTLHTALGIPEDKKIPSSKLQSISKKPVGSKITVKGKSKTVTTKLKKKIGFAKAAKKFKH